MRPNPGVVARPLIVGGLVLVALLALHSGAVGLEAGDTLPDAWIETQKITPDDADEPGSLGSSHWGVEFGSEIELDGGTLVVSTQGDSTSDSSYEDGHDWAYVFTRNEQGEWTQTSKLVPANAHAGDTFAFSLALDEEAGVLVAGNPADESIHVFERNGPGDWEETQVIHRDRHTFGWSVAVSGETIVSTSTAGVFIFEKQDGDWKQISLLEEVVGPADLEGDTLVARQWPENRPFAVYEQRSDGWSQTNELLPPEPASEDGPVAGVVDLRDDRSAIVLGAATDRRVLGQETTSGVAAPAVGSAWIYELEDGEWTMTADIPNPDPFPFEKFGNDVSITTDHVAVGAPGDVHNGDDGAGAVYVYEHTLEGWTLTSKLRNSDGGPYGGIDFFGESVDIEGGMLVAGAPWDDNRRDGTPPPLDDNGDVPPCLHREIVWGCDEGEYAGSAYAFRASGSYVGELASE